MGKIILHPDKFDRAGVFANYMKRHIADHARMTASACQGKTDPDVSIVVRTRNDVDALRVMFSDLKKQKFEGRVQVIVVDTESTDGTAELAKNEGALLISIKQADFDYPKSLNMGFEAAKHPFVFSFVGHSAFSNTYVLRTATRYADRPDFGGAYGSCLPDSNAKLPEVLGVLLYYPFRAPARTVKKSIPGVLAANCSVYSRAAWKAAGGFDERFAAGGEDAELARVLLERGYSIVHDMALSMHHTHGLGWIKTTRQALYWLRLSNPLPFEPDRLRKYRNDLD